MSLGWRGRWLLMGLEASLVAVALALGWLFDQPPLARLAWSRPGIFWGAAAALPMAAGLGLCLRWPDGPWRSLERLVDDQLAPLFRNWSLAELAIAAALAGLGEEMIFRGVIQEAIERWLGGWGLAAPPAAVLLAALLFGVAHSISTAYVVFATVVGVYLGALFVLTGDLAAPILAHGLYDFVALVYLARVRPPSSTAAEDVAEAQPAPTESP